MTDHSSDPERWVDLYADTLYAYALKTIRRPDVAQNLVQETFLAALQSRDAFKGLSSEKTWLFGILKHKILDHLKHKYREIPETDLIDKDKEEYQGDFFDLANGMLKNPPLEWQWDPSRTAENKEFWKTFEDCLKHLPAQSAEAFTLKELQQNKGEEICKVLGVSATNLWVLLHRARLQLRACLERNWFAEND